MENENIAKQLEEIITKLDHIHTFTTTFATAMLIFYIIATIAFIVIAIINDP